MNTPIIGITPDRNDGAENIESEFFVRRNYCAAVIAGGGIPVILPYSMEAVDQYLDMIDGLLITGGMFDVAPAMYGMEAKHPEKAHYKQDRTNFEQALLRGAIKKNIPILGICGGMQLIAIEMGAKMVQYIPAEINTDIEHKQVGMCDHAAHSIRINKGTLLHGIVNVDECEVNSLHHQSVMNGNDRLKISATANDGVVEAIEVPELSFCLGVQWHPEYFVNPSEQNIFTQLVNAAK